MGEWRPRRHGKSATARQAKHPAASGGRRGVRAGKPRGNEAAKPKRHVGEWVRPLNVPLDCSKEEAQRQLRLHGLLGVPHFGHGGAYRAQIFDS